MAGKDLSAELFSDTPSTTGRDLSGDLFGAEPISRLEKMKQGVIDPINGAAQMLTHLLPDSVVRAGNAANNWIADKTGLVANVPASGVDGLVQKQEADYQAKRTAAGESGFDGYRTIGNIVSPANLALASKLPVAASLGGRVLTGMAGGGATSAVNPITDGGDFWSEKGKQVGLGAAFGGTVPAITGGVSRLVSPNASINPELQLLTKEGVKPTIGQTLGGWSNALEEKAQGIPLVGDAIATARMKARQEFNNAAINRATDPIGVKIEGTGTQAVQDAGNAISGVYDKAKAAMGGFKIDPQANSELSNLRMLATTGLQGRERKTINSYFTDYLNRNSLTADSFKELDSKLNSDIAKFGSGDAYQQKVADALSEVQRIVTDNAKRANPVAANLFNQADSAYANLVRVEGASVAGKGSGGVFTPGQLLTAVRGADKSVRDRATARGTALMQDLATAGQSVLGNKIPDSGTAGRLMPFVTGGAAFANPIVTGGGLLGGLAMYTQPMQNLLRGAVSSRPQSAQAVSDVLRKTSPALIPAGAQFGLGLLN